MWGSLPERQVTWKKADTLEQPKKSNENTHTTEEGGVHLRPVAPDEFGEGLPYAPINWPNPGDNWGWKVGKRVAMQGHYLDRYIYPPRHYCKYKRKGYASKLSIVRFIEEKFPDADKVSFFASFSWKIPAKNQPSPTTTGNIEGSYLVPLEEISEVSGPDSLSDGVSCKAGNKACNSLAIQAEDQKLAAMPCDICCSEPRFCRDCCCILCCKTINTDYGGYSYLKCEATVEGGHICGHAAHLNCALRAYMAGTVGGSIGLDAEYYCRRCDARKDLITHVVKLLQICESIESREDIEKILNVGVCILRGSIKTSAKRLLNRIECSIIKLKCGSSLEDIWYAEENDVENITGVINNISDEMEVTNRVINDKSDGMEVTERVIDVMGDEMEVTDHVINDTSDEMVVTHYQDFTFYVLSLLPDLTKMSDSRNEYQKIDEEVDHALRGLKKSQEVEYKIAEDRLNGQKNFLKNLLDQLDKERTELTRRFPKINPATLTHPVLDRAEQVKREITKLKEMNQIAHGFGKAPKGILNQHFGMNIDD